MIGQASFHNNTGYPPPLTFDNNVKKCFKVISPTRGFRYANINIFYIYPSIQQGNLIKIPVVFSDSLCLKLHCRVFDLYSLCLSVPKQYAGQSLSNV